MKKSIFFVTLLMTSFSLSQVRYKTNEDPVKKEKSAKSLSVEMSNTNKIHNTTPKENTSNQASKTTTNHLASNTKDNSSLNEVNSTSNSSTHKKHYIILIDASASIKGSDQQQVFNVLKDLPNTIGFTINDYVSLIPFGISNSNPNFNAHYRLNQSILMQKFRIEEYNSFLQNINSGFFTADWTGLSFVIPRSIYLFDKKKSKVSETNFIVITDGIYNSINPIEEINSLSNNGINSSETAKKQIADFNKFFRTEDKDERKIGNLTVSTKKLLPSGVEFIDVNTLAEINNLKNGNVEVGRTLKGYVLDFNLKDKPNIFKILNIDFVLKKGNEIVKELEQEEERNFTYSFDNKADDYKLEAEFDILYNDPIYGRQLLTYRDNPNLKITYPLTFEEKKNVLLVFPLMDGMFKMASGIGISTQDGAVAFWNILLLIIGLALAVYFIVKYIKKNKENKNAENVVIK